MDEAKYKSLVLVIVVLAHAGMTLLTLLGAVASKPDILQEDAKRRLISYIILGWSIGLVSLFFLNKLLTE